MGIISLADSWKSQNISRSVDMGSVDIIVAKRNSVEWLETDIMVAIFKKTLMWDYEIRYKLGSLGGW